MKKSNKQKINPEELLKDTDKLLNFINDLDNLNFETVDIEKLEEEIGLIEKQIKSKYKDVLPKDYKNNLDSEE